MKRTLLTILAIFYLCVSSGATVHFHYCMGELVSWGLHQHKKDKCDFCGMPTSKSKAKSCCKDEQQQVKVDNSQKLNQTVYDFNAPSVAILSTPILLNDDLVTSAVLNKAAFSNAPPDGKPVPVFIKNCTYRI